MANPRGRPPKPPEERKDITVGFRADESERGQFEQAAALAGVKLSDWIRARLLACAQREIKRAAKL